MNPAFRTRVVLLGCALASLVSGAERTGDLSGSPIEGVHWITLHTRTEARFDAVYALLHDTLGLPLLFAPERHGSRRYAGLFAGGTVIEPCGPFPASPYRTDATETRFHTLSFRSRLPANAIAAALARAELHHEPPTRAPLPTSPLQVRVTALSSPFMPVSVSEPPPTGSDNTAAAGEGGGSDTLIAGLAEVHVGYSSAERLARWQAVAGRAADSELSFSKGPVVRLVAADRDEILGLVFETPSIEAARRRLVEKNVAFVETAEGLSIASGHTGGARLMLRAAVPREP